MASALMDDRAVLSEISNLITKCDFRVKNSGPITAETRLISDLGFDSVSMLELVTAIEEAFDITIDFEDLDIEVLNVAGLLASLVAGKIAA